MEENRVQQVVVESELMEDLFRGDLTVVEGIPDDAGFVKMWEEPARRTYNFMFRSEEFPAVEEGEPAPEIEPTIVKRRVNNSTHWVCPNCFETMDNGDVR